MSRLVQLAVTGVALAAIGAALAPAAQAQTPTTVETTKKYRIKLGPAFPTDGDNDPVVAVGFDYDLSKTVAANPTIFNLYVDYYGKSRQNVFGGGIGLRHTLGSRLTTANFYVGAGIGVYATKVPGSSTKTDLGGKLLAGYQFNEGLFGEIDYTLLPENNNVNPNALGVKVGYRF